MTARSGISVSSNERPRAGRALAERSREKTRSPTEAASISLEGPDREARDRPWIDHNGARRVAGRRRRSRAASDNLVKLVEMKFVGFESFDLVVHGPAPLAVRLGVSGLCRTSFRAAVMNITKRNRLAEAPDCPGWCAGNGMGSGHQALACNAFGDAIRSRPKCRQMHTQLLGQNAYMKIAKMIRSQVINESVTASSQLLPRRFKRNAPKAASSKVSVTTTSIAFP